MPACPTCAALLPEGARFCPKDGTTFPVFDPAEPLIGRLLDGRYQIRARLGAGGVGSVYEAEHLGTKRVVAIKVLHQLFAGSEEFRKRFEREAQAASRLAHPSCVAVLDFGRVERVEPAEETAKLHGTLYLVMEFVRGQVLLDKLAGGPLEPREAVAIARGVLGALAHAHELGLVHRDVKPANVMLTPAGVKLLDFGLAKDTTDVGGEVLTRAGTVFGTPGYLSPEQAAGRPADARSDLYAVGVVLFEMLCGRRLFVRTDALDVVRDHLSREPDRPRSLRPSLSPEIEAIVLRALAKDPNARFDSAVELDRALAACPEARALPASGGGARGVATTARVGRLAAGGGLLFAGALAALVFAWRRPGPAPLSSVPALPSTPMAEGARRHLATALGYQRKLWCSDALEELDRALAGDDRLRQSPEVARCAIACLTAKTQAKAIHFLVDKLGASGTVALAAAAASDPSPEVRAGAARALQRLK